MGLLNTWGSVVAVEVGGGLMIRSFTVDGIQVPSWAVVGLTCTQNVRILEDAWRFFNKRPSQDVVTWSGMIGTCPMGVQIMKILLQATPSTQLGS